MKKLKCLLFPLIILTGVLFTWDVFYVSNLSSSFNVWFEDVYSKWKFGVPSFDVLPLTAFKLGWFLYFDRLQLILGLKDLS